MRMEAYQGEAGKTAYVTREACQSVSDAPGKANQMLEVMYYGLGLASEAGEVAGDIKKLLRDSSGDICRDRIGRIESELGDVLWYVAMIATTLGISLDEVAAGNVAKLRQRAENGTITGRGDR